MRALSIDRRPKPGELGQVQRMTERPIPEPGAGQVCVRILASTINIDDLHMGEGTMFGGFPVAPTPSPSKPWVVGTDLAGVVHTVGKNVSKVKPGDRVYGMRTPSCAGPWAEYGVTKASFLSPMPDGFSAIEAAALPIGSVVICSIFERLGSVSGKRVLVLGASGGIGSLMVSALTAAGAEA